jgi:uncharacterized protein YcgI (DUF1989 family)
MDLNVRIYEEDGGTFADVMGSLSLFQKTGLSQTHSFVAEPSVDEAKDFISGCLDLN